MVVVIASPTQSQPRGTTSTHLNRDMGRESRHVYVSGLPDSVSDERINSFFSSYGRVHQIERTHEGVVVSFMDVRSAQKAHAVMFPFSGLMTTSSLSSTSNGTSSPKSAEASRRRTPSPRSKDLGRMSQQRVITTAGKRLIRSEGHRRDQGRSPDAVNLCGGVSGSSLGSGSVCTSTHSSGGLQGVYVERLPPRSDGTVKEAIRDALKKHGRIVDISIEGDGDARKALVIFQRVVDMEKLVNDSHISILSMRVRIRAANHVVVQEAYNEYLSLNSPAGSGATVGPDADLPAKYASPNGNRNEVDVFHPKASRTLYVGGLESRISDETLRRRFGKYGTILDVDVKNYESPSPFAFIQFADIDSAVRAINTHVSTVQPANKKGKKFQPNFGRSMTTNKLWIGSIPPQIAEEYVIQKLRSLSEGVVDVVVDMRVRQAIVVFSSTESAQAALNRIKAGVPKQFVFKVESGEARVPADFCSDRLHDHFIDRKHGGIPVKTPTSIPPTPTAGSGCIPVGASSVPDDDSLTALLAPPPDPPSDMPSYRYEHHRDQRRSPAHSRRRERSRERSQERSRHRKSSKYDYDKGSARKKEKKERKQSASSDSSISSSEDSSLTRLRSASNDSRASSPLLYSQRNKDRRREERREIRSDRNVNGKPRNTSSSRRSPFEVSKWTDRKATRHSPAVDERLPQTMQASNVSAVAVGTITPTPDDRKSGDSGFYDDVSRPPLDPPPAPPPMETLSQIPSPPPADPPVRRKPSPRSNSHSQHCTPHFVSPPSSSRHESGASRHQSHHLTQEPQSISAQHRHQSLSSGPGPSTGTPPNSSHSQKRHSFDGQSSHTRPHSTSQPSHRTRTGKWPWNDLLRSPCVFPDFASTTLSDPRPLRNESPRVISSHLPLPPFAGADRHPRSVAGEWRKRSSGSAASAEGGYSVSQRRASGGSGIISSSRPLVSSSSEDRPHLYTPVSTHAAPAHATVSRSPSSSGASGGIDSDAQLSPDAAPLPPPPPSALDLLCEPDDVPILADGWSGRLAEIGSRLTDVNASLEEAHRGVAELDDQHHRHPSTSSATETTPTSSRHRPSGAPLTTPRTDSFEERLRSINQKKKSSFDDFTLNITQERILAAKASAPDPLGVAPFPVLSSGSGLSSSGLGKNVAAHRPALSITIPHHGGGSQSVGTPSSSRMDSPVSSRKSGAPCGSASTSRPPASAQATSLSTPPVRLAAPPTAPVIAYPPNFSVPPPNFSAASSSSIYAPSTTPESQTSPILSAPPPPPQLPPTTQESTSNREALPLKSPTTIPVSCPSAKVGTSAATPTTRPFLGASTQPHSSSVTTPHHSNHGGNSFSYPSSHTSSQGQPHHIASHPTQGTPKSVSNKIPLTSQRTGEKHTPQRHDSMSALRSPIPTAVSSLTGRSSSVSDARKSGAATVAHKDPSTELLAELFHNKPPTTDFRKLPKIEKKPSAATVHSEKEHHAHEQSKKHSGNTEHHKKDKEHKMAKEERKRNRDEERDKKKPRKAEKERQREKKSKKQKKRSRQSSSDDGSSSDDSDYQRHRVQLDSSDEEDEGPRPENRKPAESEADDSSDEEEDVVRVEKSANGNSSDDESKNINMEDVFGADSTDNEKTLSIEEKEKKRKKIRKDSSDENEAPKKKLTKSDKLDFESIFGPDKTDKSRKNEKERKEKQRETELKKKDKKEMSKRKGDSRDSKPAKRSKKSHQSDESSASEMETHAALKIEDDQIQCSATEFSQSTVTSEKVEEPTIKEEIIDVKPEEIPMETDAPEQLKIVQEPEEENKETLAQNPPPEAETESSIITSKPPQQLTSTTTEQTRPKLLTKAAMKIFVPSQSTTANSTVSATQPSTEADSDDESTDYDDVFATALSAPASGQQDATATSFLPPARRVSTSSSGATEPDEVSESDSDSQRSRHRAVELVDAAAGYASVCEPPAANIDEATTSSDECSTTKASLTMTSVQEPPPTSNSGSALDVTEQSSICEQQETQQEVVETTVQAPPAPDVITTPCEQPTIDDEAKKAVRGISDLQETEDAVKSIFDGDDEEEEPQYPTLVFVPGKNGAVVASAGLSSAGEAALASTSVAVTNEETNRATSAIADVDDEVENAGVASGDVSDEQLLRESFVEEPILEEKPAAEKNAEAAHAPKEAPSTDAASNVIVIEDDDIIEVPTTNSSVKEQEPTYSSSSQPMTATMSTPISVAIPELRKASTPMQSPKTVTNTEQATFVPPPLVPPVKASPVPTSEFVSALPAASPQMQMLQMASRDPVAYYQQMSQTFGQPMATALLAQLQAIQQLPTSQAQQYLLELQRQQQIKTSPAVPITTVPSQVNVSIQQERKSMAVPPQPRTVESAVVTPLAAASPSGTSSGHSADVAKHLSSFGLSSPEVEAMNPSANPLSGDAQAVGDHTLNILNLAGAIAMNSLLAINQQATGTGFPAAAQLAAQNPLLANAAKMMLSMNLMNAAAAGADRPSASSSTSDLLSLAGSQPDTNAVTMANLQQAMLLQQYAALARGQLPGVNPRLAALHMSLKRTAENGTSHQSDRKRSYPSGELPNQVEDFRHRIHSDSEALVKQRRTERIMIPHVPVSKDDMERCLNRILNEEIYNIYEDDSGPERKAPTPLPSPACSSKETVCSSSSGASSPFERKLSIDEILEIIASRPVEKDGGIASTGSAFRRRFPVVWQGTLAMKQSETTVQMHLVYGSIEMLTRCLGDANADAKNAVPIRVNQRMRLEHAQIQGMVAKMSDAGRFACMICLPCGLSRDEIITNSDIFRTAFIDYFTSKQAAGIAVMPQTATTAGCLVHVFPPGEFPSSYLQYYSPQLYESITARQASFLFVVLTPDESSRPLTT
ncbi:RRM domain-containing protein [Trichostrongylus colubriformis]|uniref:RRM domain-containing protein n=1 Tax=Trichostrongylus colubriformis TaxID=6319 RepID=A0AAN8F1A6_TRICO